MVEVLEDASLNRDVLVLPDGSINFPQAGTIRAAGRSVSDVRASLVSGLAPNFASEPTVYVSVSTLAVPRIFDPVPPRTDGVFITGEITAPGRIEVTPGTTVLQAIAQAGGLTRFAAERRIQLRRGDKIYTYNYTGTGGGIRGSTTLIPGDVIVVPQRRLFE